MTRDHPFLLSAVALSDLGLRRKNNEDATLILPAFKVYAVADGMGGHEAGEVASETVVKSITAALSGADGAASATAAQKCRIVSGALKEASEWIWRYARQQNLRSCGTTVVALVFDSQGSERATVLHAGDSRAYRFRGALLERLTKDHSLAEAAGLGDAKVLPPGLQCVITRAVGIAQKVRIEETEVTVAEGDVFLLCSDGLSTMVKHSRIQDILKATRDEPLEKIAGRLVEEANRCGGLDNVSVVVVRVEPRPEGMEDTTTSVGIDTTEAGPSSGVSPGGTPTLPRATGGGGVPPKPGQVFDPGQGPIGTGFGATVRLGLGLIAILLLILALLSLLDRKNAILAVTRRSVEKVDVKSTKPEPEQRPESAIPLMFGEDSGTSAVLPEAEVEGVVPIPAATDEGQGDVPAPGIRLPPALEPGGDRSAIE